MIQSGYIFSISSIVPARPSSAIFCERPGRLNLETTERRCNLSLLARHERDQEEQKSWNRDDAQEWAEAYAAVFPPYQLLIESYHKAQEVVNWNETPSASLRQVGG